MTLAALLFAVALGAALMAVWLWSAWHPERARCALCRATRSSPVAVNAAHSSAKRGHHAASNGQPSAAAAGDASP
jgi:hypothetical protein